MTKKKIISWGLSLVMALTVFSIPTGAFADEENPQDAEYCFAYLLYEDTDDEDGNGEDKYSVIPIGESGDIIDYELIGTDNDVVICKKEDEAWIPCEGTYQWTNESPDVIGIGHYVEHDGNQEGYLIDQSGTVTTNFGAALVPLQGGLATLHVTVFDETGAELVSEQQLTIEATQYDADKAKFEPYFEFIKEYDDEDQLVWWADYDDQEVRGALLPLDQYTEDMLAETNPVFTESDLNRIVITATINGKDYKAKYDPEFPGEYQFVAKIPKVGLGTTVTVNYTAGEYTYPEKTIVSREIEPTIVCKNFTYDGKAHKTYIVSVSYGSVKFTKGTDYTIESIEPASLKNVGVGYVEISSTPNRKYRFFKEGTYRVNPKGTSIKKLKKAKKAITVKWNKQTAKMTVTRISGYQIQVATNKAFTKNKKTVTVKGYSKDSTKVTKLKKKTKYFVRVRTYKGSCYSAWSKVKSIKTK